MANWGGPLYNCFWNDSKHVVHIESCGESNNRGGCDKIPPIDNNIFQESCIGVEIDIDSKGLMGGLQEVIFASWAVEVIQLGSIYARMI